MINPNLLSDSLAAEVAMEIILSSCEKKVRERLSYEIGKELQDILATYANEAKRTVFFEKLLSSLSSHERKFASMMQEIWEEERKIIVANLKKMKKAWLQKDKIDELLYPRKQFEKKIASETKMLFEPIMEERAKEELDKIARQLRKPRKDKQDVGVIGAFDVENPEVQKWLNEYTPKFSNKLETVSTDKLRSELIEGMKEGEGVPKLINRVNTTYANWNKVRSEAIARSEAMRASNRGALESYRQSGVVEKKIWITFHDKRTCFPKNTKIITNKGERNIQDIKKGDVVLSHLGWQRVKEIMNRKYFGNLIKIKTSDRKRLIATEDHPVYEVNKGWIEIKDLTEGSKLKTSEDQIVNVIDILNFKCLNSQNFISKFFKFLISLNVFQGIRMPIFAINFKTKIILRNKKINSKRINLIFLNKINIQFLKNLPNSCFNRCFATIFSTARKRTKSSNFLLRRCDSKFLSAIQAFDINRWTPTFFRAIFNVFSFGSENLAASKANFIKSKLYFAFPTTNNISVSNRFINSKRLSTNRANFSYLFKNFSTFLRAKFLFNSTSPNIESFTTLFTSFKSTCFSSFMITISRTIKRIVRFLDLIFRSKFFTTIFTYIHDFLRYITILIKTSQSHIVYNFEVENAHTYFANGILVHNCYSCADLDGKIISLEDNYFNLGDPDEVIERGGRTYTFKNDYEDIGVPPRHARCRCTISAYFEE